MHSLCIPAFAVVCLGTLTAQSVTLDKSGGALGGTAIFSIAGPPSTVYVLVLATSERPTPVPELGITLDVPLDLLELSAVLPGFVGVFPPAGTVAPVLPLPNIPALESLVLSAQAVGGDPLVVSNLVRLTPQTPGTFKPALGQPSVPIAGGGHAAAGNGELLFVGGSGPLAQRYASRTEEWSAAGVSFGVGLLSQTTGLADGRVLFTGGIGLDGQPTSAAAVYDPATQQTTTLSMGIARAGHGASLLGDGRVLITGGFEVVSLTDPIALFAGIRASTELFDPATNTFASGPNMLEARALHASTSLTNGQALITGGMTLIPIVNLPTVSATAYRFNPATGSFGLPALMNGARFLHSAVGLSDGKVLLAGGLTLDHSTFLVTLNILDIVVGTRTDCQLYAPGVLGFGTFTTVAGMQEGRAGAAIAPLPNGGALIAGGFRLTIDIPTQTFVATATASADVFRQGPNAIAGTGAMGAARLFPISANLPDGTVLVVGGGGAAEIYQR